MAFTTCVSATSAIGMTVSTGIRAVVSDARNERVSSIASVAGIAGDQVGELPQAGAAGFLSATRSPCFSTLQSCCGAFR